MTKESEARSQPARQRRYKQINIANTNAVQLLNGSLRLSLPPGTEIVAVASQGRLYPVGLTVLLYHPDFEIVADYEEIPQAMHGFYGYEEVGA
jgi:hypothetical protein